MSDGINPFAKIKHFEEPARKRFLDNSEYIHVDHVLIKFENEQTISIYAIAVIRVLILTGARRSAIETLRWDSIDLAAGNIPLADSKFGPHNIEIPAAGRKILLPLKFSGSESVFPGRSGGRFRLNWIWNEVRLRVKISDVRLHDLRRSYETRVAEVGISIPAIARILEHSAIWTTLRYLHV